MNKTELIAAVAEKTGLSKKDSDAAVNAVLNTISKIVANNLKDTYPQENAKNLKNAKLADIQQVAKTIIKPAQLTWVIVGDKDKVLANVKSLGYDVKLIDADGNPVAE